MEISEVEPLMFRSRVYALISVSLLVNIPFNTRKIVSEYLNPLQVFDHLQTFDKEVGMAGVKQTFPHSEILLGQSGMETRSVEYGGYFFPHKPVLALCLRVGYPQRWDGSFARVFPSKNRLINRTEYWTTTSSQNVSCFSKVVGGFKIEFLTPE
jgi:hypothetical protein